MTETKTFADTSTQGLSSAQAAERLQKYGPNALQEKKTSTLLRLLGYFWGPIPWMIEVAAVLSAIDRHWADFWIITVLLVFNAGVGFWQEFTAGNAVEALKKQLALKARALRDGTWQESGATDAARAAADLVLTAPGLSVIISAIEEARRIFERMNAYAIYRISETIRIMFFVVLTMVLFNFYPITAIMIILLAFFNDIPIMAIAYDHTGLAKKPVRWDMEQAISWPEIALIWGYSITSAFVTDLVKVQVYRHLQHRTPRHEKFLASMEQSLHSFGRKH